MDTTEQTKKFLEKIIKELNAHMTFLNGGETPVKKTRVSKKKEETTEEAPKEETKKSPAKKSTKKSDSDSEKPAVRIARMTPANKKKVDDFAAKYGVVVDKNLYDACRKYINDLSQEKFDAHEDKTVHMEEFVKSMIKEEKSNAAGGGPSAPAEKKVSELKNLKEVSTGIFQDTNGTLVTGPAEDEDEDMEEAKFNGEDYVLGTKTKRVYKVDPEGGPDMFVGFWGIGKFAGADD